MPKNAGMKSTYSLSINKDLQSHSQINPNHYLRMRLFSTLMILAIIGLAQAWSINFFAEKGDKMKRVSANGTKRGNCINLRSDYDWVTTSITFYPQTPAWPDPNGYTAYSKANCKGTAYYGVEGQQNPKRRFRSYRVK